jgi:hypothetical protein
VSVILIVFTFNAERHARKMEKETGDWSR